jgi:hypothetical protein
LGYLSKGTRLPTKAGLNGKDLRTTQLIIGARWTIELSHLDMEGKEMREDYQKAP